MGEDGEKPIPEETKKVWGEAIEMYLDLMKTFEQLPEEILSNKNDTFRGMKFKLPPSLFQQCVIHATDIADKNNIFRKGIEAIESSFKYDNNTLRNHRYIIYYLLILSIKAQLLSIVLYCK